MRQPVGFKLCLSLGLETSLLLGLRLLLDLGLLLCLRPALALGGLVLQNLLLGVGELAAEFVRIVSGLCFRRLCFRRLRLRDRPLKAGALDQLQARLRLPQQRRGREARDEAAQRRRIARNP